VEDILTGESPRPTVKEMLLRDFFVYIGIITCLMSAVIIVLLSSTAGDGSEGVGLDYLFGFLVLEIAVAFVIVYWRTTLYSSILMSGVEVPGEVTSVKKSGDALIVEFTYRWQAETVRSSKMVGGYITRNRITHKVGMRATLLVDPSKPKRFMVLDTMR